jgi:hypothetical protein
MEALCSSNFLSAASPNENDLSVTGRHFRECPSPVHGVLLSNRNKISHWSIIQKIYNYSIPFSIVVIEIAISVMAHP